MKLRFNKTSYLAAFGLLVLVLGIALLAPILYYTWTNNGSVAAHSAPLPSKQVIVPAGVTKVSGSPIAISIPSLNINLQVINGYYNASNGQWNLTLDKAQFATPSVLPNNISGNTLIYGHYRPEVFAYLHLIKPGAQATITTGNGYIFTYTYVGSYATQPTDTSVFDYKGAPILTVQTCSGSFFQNRQMYQFSFDGYQKVPAN